MGKMQRDKGARVEREIVGLFNDCGVFAERVPLSGAVQFRDTRGADIDIYFQGKDNGAMVGEVKARANGEGFKTLETWLGDADFLVLKRNRKEPMVLFPFHKLMQAMGKKINHCEDAKFGDDAPHNGSITKGKSNDKCSRKL